MLFNKIYRRKRNISKLSSLIFLIQCIIFVGFISIVSSITVSSQTSKPPVVSRTEWGCPHGQSIPLWLAQYYLDEWTFRIFPKVVK